ncbi:MAG: two-component system activity regulator YycH, partial [Limosilactobacillus fermentum]
TTVFNQTFNQSVDTARLKRINHIVITLDKTPTVYLMADEKYQVYRLTTTSQSLAAIKKSLVGGSQLNVDHKIVNGIPLTTFPHQISMPTYRSTINHQNLDSMAQTLMASSSVSTVSSQTTSKLITYTAGNSRRMTYNKGTGQVQYENYLGKDNSYGTQTLYTHLFDLLADTAVPLEQVQYDNVSLVGQTITYRSFVEGFPIFSDNDYGTVRIKANNDGVERYHLSPLSLGIPLPASGQKVTLPSTVTVLNALYQAGKGKDIKGLRLGYTWATDQNKSLVTLSPTYYVYYHGNWVKYQSLLKGD